MFNFKKQLLVVVHPNAGSKNWLTKESLLKHVNRLKKLMEGHITKHMLILLDGGKKYFNDIREDINNTKDPIEFNSEICNHFNHMVEIEAGFNEFGHVINFPFKIYMWYNRLYDNVLVYIDPKNSENGKEWPFNIIDYLMVKEGIKNNEYSIKLVGVQFDECILRYALAFKKRGFDVCVDMNYTDFNPNNKNNLKTKEEFEKNKIKIVWTKMA